MFWRAVEIPDIARPLKQADFGRGPGASRKAHATAIFWNMVSENATWRFTAMMDGARHGAFWSEVDTGSRLENASKQKAGVRSDAIGTGEAPGARNRPE